MAKFKGKEKKEQIQEVDDMKSEDQELELEESNSEIEALQKIADDSNVQLEINPLMISIFEDGMARYGPNEFSPNIIKRLEESTGLNITAPGFPDEIVDDEPEEKGYEVKPNLR